MALHGFADVAMIFQAALVALTAMVAYFCILNLQC